MVSRRKLAAPRAVLARPLLSQAISVARSSSDGEERVIATLAGVVVALRAFLAQSVGLADGGVQVDGQRLVARTGACIQARTSISRLTRSS